MSTALVLSRQEPASAVFDDPTDDRVIGFPKGADGTGRGAWEGSFHVKRLAPGIGLADRYRPPRDGDKQYLPRSEWGETLSAGEFEAFYREMETLTDRIASTGTGSTLLESFGAMKPLGGNSDANWVDWRSGSAGGVSDIQLVVFPSREISVASPLSQAHAVDYQGSAGLVEYAWKRVEGYYHPVDGRLRVIPPEDSLAHEFFHAAQSQAGANPARDLEGEVSTAIFRGTAGPNPSPREPSYYRNTYIPLSELLTQGGESGLRATAATMLAEGIIEEFPEGTNPYLQGSAEWAQHMNPGSLSRAEVDAIETARFNLAAANPTDVRRAHERGLTTRPEYQNGIYVDSAAGGGVIADTGSTFEVRNGHTLSSLTDEDFDSPASSGRLGVAVGASVPPCGGASHSSCVPQLDDSRVTSPEDVALYRKRLENTDEFDPAGGLKGFSEEQLRRYAELEVTAGVTDARVGALEIPEKVSTPDVKVRGVNGPHVLDDYGLVAMPKTSHELASGVKSFVTGTLVSVLLSYDSETGLDWAAAWAGEVPLLGPALLLAQGVESDDWVTMLGGTLTLASSLIDAAVWSGVISSAVGSTLSTGLGIIATAVLLVTMIVRLLTGRTDLPAGWVRWEPELKDPLPYSYLSSTPHYEWTNEYVGTRLLNGFSNWGYQASYEVLGELSDVSRDAYEDGVKVLTWNAAVAQSAAARNGVLAGWSQQQIDKETAGIRAETHALIAQLQKGSRTAFFENFDQSIQKITKGDLFTLYLDSAIGDLWKDWRDNLCEGTVRPFIPKYNPYVAGSGEASPDRFTAQMQACRAANGEAQFRAKFGLGDPHASTLKSLDELAAKAGVKDGEFRPNLHASMFETPAKQVLEGKAVELTTEGKVKTVVKAGSPVFPDVTIKPQTPVKKDFDWSFLTAIAATSKDTVKQPVTELMRTVNGYGKAGQTVEVRDQAGARVCQATVSVYGLWGCSLADPLKPGRTKELTLWENGASLGVRVILDAPTLKAEAWLTDDGASSPTLVRATGIPGHALTNTIACTIPSGEKIEKMFDTTLPETGILETTPGPDVVAGIPAGSSCTYIVADKSIYDYDHAPFPLVDAAGAPPKIEEPPAVTAPVNKLYEGEDPTWTGGQIKTDIATGFVGRAFNTRENGTLTVAGIPQPGNYTVTMKLDARNTDLSFGVRVNGDFMNELTVKIPSNTTSQITFTVSLKAGTNTLQFIPGGKLPNIDRLTITN